jgi:acetyl-CoA acyltransferase
MLRRALLSTSAAAASSSGKRAVAVIDGVRTPFSLAQTTYGELMCVDLQALALRGLLTRTALDPATVDYLYLGSVIQEPSTSNIAREAGMAAGFPFSVPAHVVTQACISANQAICAGAEKILAGGAEVVVAGGAETFSDVVRFPLRSRVLVFWAPPPRPLLTRTLLALHCSRFAWQRPCVAACCACPRQPRR